MHDNLMKVWVEEIWFQNAHAKCKSLRFGNSMLTFDVFFTHLTDEMQNQLLKENTNILSIPPG